MTIDELFAIREMMHDVLIERVKARMGEVLKRIKALKTQHEDERTQSRKV